jgi:hypothetical protein
MLIKTLQSTGHLTVGLNVPDEKNIIFVSPQYASWEQLLSRNKLILQKQAGGGASRTELLNIAKNYTKAMTPAACFEGIGENIIVTGHQAIWHHCGILAKNAITSKFAADVNGCPIHLVLDHDVCDTAIVLPKKQMDGDWCFEKIEIEPAQNPVPLGFRPAPKGHAPQKEIIQALSDAIGRIYGKQFCCMIWSQYLGLPSNCLPDFKNVADFITCFQAMLNSALGIKMLYLPVSLLSASSCFTDFAASVIINASYFAHSYNNAAFDQMKYKNNNTSETIRPLTVDYSKGFIELPFWLVSSQGRRTSLYVKLADSGKIKICTAATGLGGLDSSENDGKIEQLKIILNQQKYYLWPKAVTLTLFVRLFLADWFVHGVGGAFYESITDKIIEDYYRIEKLRFGVATATVTLPLCDCAGTAGETSDELKLRLRDFKYNPEKFIEAPLMQTEPVKSLLDKKKKLIEITHNHCLTAQEKKSAWEAIATVNKALFQFTKNALQNLNEKIKQLDSRCLAQQVLNCRQYFFGLLPEEILKDMLQKETIENNEG